MRAQLAKVIQRYRGLQRRERILVAAVLVTVLVSLWASLAYAPLRDKYNSRRGEINTLNATLTGLRTQLVGLNQQRDQDPHQEIKQRLQRTQQEIAQLDAQLKTRLHGLIDPKQMAGVLEAMLQQNTSLQLLRVQSLGAQPLITQDTDETEDAASATTQPASKKVDIYQHAVEIEFTGSYLATLAYLQALKALPWEFYWDAVHYEVEHYPQARVVITVHTLSLQEGWIGV
ncbi:MAG: hypothetical protein HY080_14140 [Gammaproteobacteria bacterium]|nr:hypothetical protein [Gammaproteobacteria bacterium]